MVGLNFQIKTFIEITRVVTFCKYLVDAKYEVLIM